MERHCINPTLREREATRDARRRSPSFCRVGLQDSHFVMKLEESLSELLTRCALSTSILQYSGRHHLCAQHFREWVSAG
jgi:hypothetical protein